MSPPSLIFSAQTPDGQEIGISDGSFAFDVIWLAEFASRGWIIPLGQTIEHVVQQKYRTMPWAIDGCKYEGQLYSVPLRVDLGVLYYRSDLTSPPPKTWQDLIAEANEVRRGRKDIPDGFVWQGSQQEGLICDFVEVLAGYEGTILDSQGLPTVTVNKPEAVEALTTMMNWLAISPKDISTYDEESAVIRWQNGFAVFMRNWYNALSQVTDPIAKVQNAAHFTAIPHGEAPTQRIGYSCVGGWQLGINAASQNQELAQQFIQYVIQNRSTELGTTSDILSAHPADAWRSDTSIAEIATHMVFRPRSPNYMQVSRKMQSTIFKALSDSNQNPTRQTAIAVAALNQLKSEWESILRT